MGALCGCRQIELSPLEYSATQYVGLIFIDDNPTQFTRACDNRFSPFHFCNRIKNMTMSWEKLLCRERRRPSTNPGDLRAEFERDYDRAFFSTPVKRLQDKAQVFPLEPNDAVRTRLTHSLEEASVARGIATAACKWLRKEGDIITSSMP